MLEWYGVEAMADDAGHGECLTDEQPAVLETYRRWGQLGERLVAALLLVTVLAMASAQYG